MNQIRLYIENEEIELVEQIQFAINKQFEDINNPTNIINDYSKTIKIPFSQHNNAVFGKIFSPDRVILGGQQSVTGISFDPYKKLDFRLEWNEDVLMQGYAKLLNVIMENGKGHYEMSLNGELGKLFQEFKKITFVYSADSSNYWIDYHDIFEETMDKDLIYTSWNTAGQSQMTLQKKYVLFIDPITHEIVKVPNPLYRFTDIMGFTPSNTYDDDFEYKTLQYSPSKTRDIKDYLDMVNFEKHTGFSSETIVGDNGMLPRQIGEFRSYYQQPFIYFNKLFQIFQEKAELISGYDFMLDSSWFGQENPYWRLLAMTLNKIDVNKEKTSQTAENIYNMTTMMPNNKHVYHNTGDPATMEYTTPFITPYVQQQIISEDTSISCSFDVSLGDRYFNMDPSSGGMTFSCTIPAGINIGVSEDSRDTNRLVAENGMIIDVIVAYGQADSSTGIVNPSTAQMKFIVLDDTSTIIPVTSKNVNYVRLGTLPSYEQQAVYNFELPVNIYIPSKKNNTNINRFKIYIQYRWFLNDFPIGNPHWIQPVVFCLGPANAKIVNLKYIPRSHYLFTLSDLWDNEHTIFDVVLRYCKMFRILIEVDHIHKKIYFRQQKKYFENYTVEDWTDKLDMSKQWKMTPIQWDAKYINFNYEDNDSKLGSDYREKNGVNYGDYKLKTAYNFNDETNDLFEKCYSPMINTDNVLSFKTLFQDLEIVYSFSNTEEFVYSKDDEGKYIQNFGTFYFYNGLKNFDTTPSLRFVATRISDDTDLQIGTNTYCYQDGINERATDKYLALQNYAMKNWKNYLSLFNKPAAYYTKTNHFSNSVSIYEAIWENYITERYNIQNKLLIAYFNLSPRDFALFRFNKFVTINNQLYFVNKILDYNLTTKDSTKVELLTILNPDMYWMNNF